MKVVDIVFLISPRGFIKTNVVGSLPYWRRRGGFKATGTEYHAEIVERLESFDR